MGWKPLLYFANGTIYFSDLNESCPIPSMEAIGAKLTAELDAALRRDVASLMVGDPRGNMLPKPELMSFNESRSYLERAGRIMTRQSFTRKPMTDQRKVVETYWQSKGQSEALSDREVEQFAARIAVAQPEMIAFKFFKAMMDPRKVTAVGKDGAAMAENLYEATFGIGTWNALQSTSTLMAAKDMASTIDHYWALTGTAVAHPEVSSVAELPDDTRMEVLIGLFA
jgi:hypothetical protein